MAAAREVSRRAHLWAWVLWGVANAVGIALVVLADDDERLVSLGPDHGPSAGEALGVLLVVAGWVVLDALTIRSWSRSRWSPRARRAAVAAAVVGVVALVVAVGFGTGSSWLVGASLLGVVQLTAAVSVVPPRARATRVA